MCEEHKIFFYLFSSPFSKEEEEEEEDEEVQASCKNFVNTLFWYAL